MFHTEFPKSILVLVPLAFVVLSSCIGQKSGDSLLDYSQSAERLFVDAMDEFDDKDCVSAEPKFQEVRRQFPYSRYAVLSELRIADCQFMQDNHAEAAVLYEQFVAAHPTHEEAHYAAFRRGLSFVKMIPKDVFILPASYERDQSATRDARNALNRFLQTYPKSQWRDEAEVLLRDVVDALVRHEIYVAKFYLARDDKVAAAVRLEKVRENFKESTLVPDAMFLQAMTYLELDKIEEATRVLGEIITYYPTHYQSLMAKDYLNHLGKGRKRGTDG
jgi:outer membrane protein assembly factor BamD